MNISDPKQQIQDYLAGQMSPEEEKQFDSWLKQNPEGQKLFKQSAKDYQAIRWAGQWDKPDEKQAYAQLQQRLHKHRLYSGLWKYAALFFLLLRYFLLATTHTATASFSFGRIPGESQVPYADSFQRTTGTFSRYSANHQRVVLQSEYPAT